MFLNPIMLLGLSALSVPVLIHLMNRRKFQRLAWAAMRFVQLSVQKNQRRMHVEDLLLLILRCLLLALLALALARPTLRAAAGLFAKQRVCMVLVVDQSGSMQAQDGVNSRLDNAKKAAEAALDALPGGSSVALLGASDIAQGLIPEPTADLNLARKSVRELKPTDRSSDVLAALRQAVDILSRISDAKCEILLVSDGQAAAFARLEQIRQTLREAAAAGVQSRIVLVGPRIEQNLGVSDLRLAEGLAPINRPLRFEAQVTNYGTAIAQAIRVALQVDQDAPSDEAIIDSLEPGQTRSVSCFARLKSADYHMVSAAVATDRQPLDDRRAIVVRAIAQLKLLLVDGDPGRSATDAETFYLRQALQPVAPAQRGEYYLQVQTITPAELEQARFEEFDAVMIANVADFSDTSLSALSAYVRRGGGLAIFPGHNTQPAFYNSKLFKQYGLLPAQLGAARGDAGQEKDFITLRAQKRYEHPVAQLWNDPASGSPASAHFFRSYELQPAAAQGPENQATRVLFYYSDGKPAVMDKSVGYGQVVLFSSTASARWNDLPLRPGLFVPLMHRTLGSLIRRQDEALNVPVGQPLVYRAAAELLGRDVMITRPADRQVPKDSRKVEMAGSQALVRYDNTDWAGEYEMDITAASPLKIRFAAQAEAGESSLSVLSATQRQTLEQVAQVLDNSEGQLPVAKQLQQARVGTEWSTPLILAALALAITESILAHRFSQAK